MGKREREREGKGKQHMKGWGANGCEGNRIKHSPSGLVGLEGWRKNPWHKREFCCVVLWCAFPFLRVCVMRVKEREGEGERG